MLQVYKATSGKMGVDNKTGKAVDLRYARFQYVKNGGPTPEGKYSINLVPNPDRQASVVLDEKKEPTDPDTYQLTGSPEGGIERVGEIRFEAGGKTLKLDYTLLWGNFRSRLDPESVQQPKGPDGKRLTGVKARDLYTFYLHDSSKGGSSGCHECESSFFDRLLKYRADNPDEKKIMVKVQYKSPTQSINGGTEKH